MAICVRRLFVVDPTDGLLVCLLCNDSNALNDSCCACNLELIPYLVGDILIEIIWRNRFHQGRFRK